MLRSIFFPLLLIGLLWLGGCSMPGSRESERKAALDNFMLALRWQQYPAAASYFSDDLRAAFLAQMEALKGLNVTEVRVAQLDFKENGEQVGVRLEMDYYRLPSVTLKTLRIDQNWHYRRDATGESGYMITTPFPQVP